jgi:FrmR/RcnR family transcriptional regulator, repressor of rcnA expression
MGYTGDRGILIGMSHTVRKRKKLSLRVARIRGQVEALTRALEGEAECGDVLRLIASARGAMDSLMAEVIEGHIRDHAFRGARATSEEGRGGPGSGGHHSFIFEIGRWPAGRLDQGVRARAFSMATLR